MGFLTRRSRDGGAYQFVPGCTIRPRRYIGRKSRIVTRYVMGFATWARCEGCGLELRLRGGRIPPHQPGPPRFDRCPRCGRRHRASYNDPICATCAADIEAASQLDEEVDDGDWSETDTES